jgi:hypothetical protein
VISFKQYFYINERYSDKPIDREDVLNIVDDEIDGLRDLIDKLEKDLDDDIDDEVREQVQAELKELMTKELKAQVQHYMRDILPDLVSAGEIDFRPQDEGQFQVSAEDEGAGGDEIWTAGITEGGHINVIDATTGQTVARFAPRGQLTTDPNVSGNLVTFTIKDSETGFRVGQVHELPSGRLVNTFRAGKPGGDAALPELRFRPGKEWAASAEKEFGFMRDKGGAGRSIGAKKSGVESTFGRVERTPPPRGDIEDMEDRILDMERKAAARKTVEIQDA